MQSTERVQSCVLSAQLCQNFPVNWTIADRVALADWRLADCLTQASLAETTISLISRDRARKSDHCDADQPIRFSGLKFGAEHSSASDCPPKPLFNFVKMLFLKPFLGSFSHLIIAKL